MFFRKEKLGNAKNKVLVGVAWPYANGDLHIGHLAGYLLPADIFARFNRLIGNDVVMVSGSDCYGTPVMLEADKKGVKPGAIAEKYHSGQLRLFEAAGINFDLFTKTTTENHKEITQNFFLKLLEKRLLFKKTTKQFFSEEDKRFLPDRYVEGKCPNCGYEAARSDECEHCGTVLNPEELLNPRDKINQNKLSLKETEHYFLDWPKLQDFLEKYFEDRRNKWKFWIQAETEKWLEKGLKPRAITRDLDWGVELPIDKIPKNLQIDNIKNKRIYVWFEAVIGYLSATVEWAKKNKRDWKEFWYGENLSHYYFMGKDNLVFHTLFWPGELYSFDPLIHLPDVPAINQFLNLEGQKFSKSRNISIDSYELVKFFGADPVRFYLASIMPENADSSFFWDDFRNKINGTLIGNFSNFVNRVLNLAKDFKLPKKFEIDAEILRRGESIYESANNFLAEPRFKDYLELIIHLSDFGNKYLSETKPWETKNNNKDAFEKAITNALYIVVALNILARPLFVETGNKIDEMMNLKSGFWPKKGEFNETILSEMKKIKISNKITPLFRKIEAPDIENYQKTH